MSNLLVVLLAYHIQLTNVFTVHTHQLQREAKRIVFVWVIHMRTRSLFTVIGDGHLVFPYRALSNLSVY